MKKNEMRRGKGPRADAKTVDPAPGDDLGGGYVIPAPRGRRIMRGYRQTSQFPYPARDIFLATSPLTRESGPSYARILFMRAHTCPAARIKQLTK